MWNKKRFSAIEKRLKQLECPHENIYVGDHYGPPYAACRDCGKVHNGLIAQARERNTGKS